MKIKDYINNKISIEKENVVEIHKSSKVKKNKIVIKGKNNRVIIGENANLRGVIIDIRGENCLLHIGKNTIIGQDSYITIKEKGKKVIIGQECMLSRNVKIMSSDGHDILSQGKKINYAKDIIIEDKVWLADNVTVLKGVTIGKGSVVAINSTVTKDVIVQSIVAGNPAKEIKKDISWRKELIY